MAGADRAGALAAQVREAFEADTPLRITGGGSKTALGRTVAGVPLETVGHRGIVDYAPAELVVTVRAGTPLAELEAELGRQGQMLAFEPPHLGPGATVGGTLACGLSGPRRPYAGAARDFLLGVRMVNGRGELLRFGAPVMKNVAGYDIPRLQAGAQGTLGVLLEASLKVWPRPECEHTRWLELDAGAALATMNRLAGRPLPLSAAAHLDGRLWLRLSGAGAALTAAARAAGGEEAAPEQAAAFWTALRERRLPFFGNGEGLWCLSVPPAAPLAELPGAWLLDWSGARRWLRTEAPGETVHAAAAAAGGHAVWLDREQARLPPLPPGLAALHRRLKGAFDPAGILNPGRLYEDL